MEKGEIHHFKVNRLRRLYVLWQNSFVSRHNKTTLKLKRMKKHSSKLLLFQNWDEKDGINPPPQLTKSSEDSLTLEEI